MDAFTWTPHNFGLSHKAQNPKGCEWSQAYQWGGQTEASESENIDY